MEKQKVTVEFQNKFCDRLYNTVQKAEFAWLKENCDDESKWVDLIQAVDMAMYNVIKEFFDNKGENKDGCMGNGLFFANNNEPLEIKDSKTEKEVLAEADDSSPSYCMLKEFYGRK